MTVYEFGGKKECNSITELKEVLLHRTKNGSNEFELRTNTEYPFLTILVKNDLACVHYFENEEDCGYYAYVDDEESTNEEYVIFNTGSEEAETEVSKDLVISVSYAYDAAIEFYKTNKRSIKMKWFEL